jgi:hypothetical protein
MVILVVMVIFSNVSGLFNNLFFRTINDFITYSSPRLMSIGFR